MPIKFTPKIVSRFREPEPEPTMEFMVDGKPEQGTFSIERGIQTLNARGGVDRDVTSVHPDLKEGEICVYRIGSLVPDIISGVS